MSVATTLAALQAIHLTITGVNSAPTNMPSTLEQVKRPTALVWPMEATWNLQAIDLRRQSRVYVVRCYVQPVAQGLTGIDAGYDACVTLLERFGRKYLDDITLGGVVDTITAISDRGVSGGGYDLMWAQVPWWGFEYRLTVVEKSA
jgi:hypothetical protein